MSIFIDKKTKLVVQGITGRDGAFHAKQMLDYGTNVAAGVTPGKAGQNIDGIPIFDSVEDAVKITDVNTSVIFVPPAFAIDAMYEAADSGISLIVCITEGIPTQDMLILYDYLKKRNVRLIGPNCPGLISPGKSKVGILPGHIHKEGNIGVVSRSGTLSYEVVYSLVLAGYGQSTSIGIGGDPVIGTNFIDALSHFQKDPETDAIVLIGEIGGNDEQEAADFIQENISKPVVSFIAEKTAPPGKRMGHAGAIITGGGTTAKDKIEKFESVGVPVASLISKIPGLLKERLG